MNKLYKSNTNTVIVGVCGGLAEYFGFDVSTLRIIFIIGIFLGISVWLYIALWILMPIQLRY